MATAEAPARAVDADVDADADAPPTPEYVEVYDEPLHPTVFENDYVRVLKVDCPSHQDTMLHRHSQDSFFLFFRTAQIRNEVVGQEPFEVELQAGSFYWGDHLANPIVHKICVGEHQLDCMDVEFKADRPRPASRLGPALENVLENVPENVPENTVAAAAARKRDLCFENDVLRAYRVKLAPGESIDSALAAEGGGGRRESEEQGVGVGFAYLAVALRSARLTTGEARAGASWWCGAGGGGGPEDTWGNDGEHEMEVMILQPK